MKKKQKVKERHVRQLRQLIEAVTEQNGEEGTLPMSFSPLRTIITILSVAAVVCGVEVFGSRCSLLLPQIRSLGMEKARDSWK